MPYDVDARQYEQAARAIRAAGDGDLKREFSRALRDVAKPFGQRVLQSGARKLPRRGGLSQRVAGAKVGVQASTLRATISLRTKEGYALGAMDQGKLRHPVYARAGKRRRWVQQAVEPGAFRRPFEDNAETVREAMLAAGQQVLDKIKREVS